MWVGQCVRPVQGQSPAGSLLPQGPAATRTGDETVHIDPTIRDVMVMSSGVWVPAGVCICLEEESHKGCVVVVGGWITGHIAALSAEVEVTGADTAIGARDLSRVAEVC